jgi:hypothetical protein
MKLTETDIEGSILSLLQDAISHSLTGQRKISL